MNPMKPKAEGEKIPPGQFDSVAEEYQQYLHSFEGRLRIDLAWRTLCQYIPDAKQNGAGALQILDAGCGTEELAIRLADFGHYVHLIDCSRDMLERARASAQTAALTDRLKFHHDDIESLEKSFSPGSFDLVLCHTVLEFLPRPKAALQSLVALLKGGGLLSLLFRNRSGEAFRHALVDLEFEKAQATLAAKEFRDRRFGVRGCLLGAELAPRWLRGAGMRILDTRGVRILSDYLPEKAKREDALYNRILKLEIEFGDHSHYKYMARYIQLMGRKE